jgi:hypothetical protein
MKEVITPAPGVVLTLWNDDLRLALPAGTRELLARARPEIVCLHAGPDGLARGAAWLANEVRRIHPSVRLWVGIGCDGWLGMTTAGLTKLAQATDKLTGAASLAASLGAEAIVWDAEGAFEANPDLGARLARAAIYLTREAHPRLLQGHTAYDHPVRVEDHTGHGIGGHSAYPWAAWCGVDGVDFALPQVYVAPPPPPGNPQAPRLAARGALQRRMETHRRSWERAMHAGKVRPDLPTYPYVQAHHVPFSQTASVLAEHPLAALWAAPTRIDTDGTRALLALCALRRLGYTGTDCVRAFQRASGLASDGIVGPLTLAALEREEGPSALAAGGCT